MAVILKNQRRAEAIQRVSFNNEAELQKLLADNPSLLQNEAEPSLALVKREVNLGSSGYAAKRPAPSYLKPSEALTRATSSLSVAGERSAPIYAQVSRDLLSQSTAQIRAWNGCFAF